MMKNLLYILCLFISIKANAQTGDPIRDKLDTIFQNIDKTQIPTGYLAEYGSEFTPLHWYNGVLTDSNIVFNLDVFKMIYADMETARILTTTPSLPSGEATANLLDSLRKNFVPAGFSLYNLMI